MPEGSRLQPPTSHPADGPEEVRSPEPGVAPWEAPPEGLAPDVAALGASGAEGVPASVEVDVAALLPLTEASGPGGTTGERAPDVTPWAPPARASGPSRAPTPPSELPLPALLLAHEARSASMEDRPALAAKLNRLLEDMAADGGGRQTADMFHRLLEEEALGGLVDDWGWTCRAAAVEGLLSLGFPYALEVRPEDLEHLRDIRANRGKGKERYGPGVPLAVLGGGLVTQSLMEWLGSGPPSALALLQVGLSLVALLTLGLAPERGVLYRLGLMLLAVIAGLGVILTLMTPQDAGMVSGLAGLVAVLLVALRES